RVAHAEVAHAAATPPGPRTAAAEVHGQRVVRARRSDVAQAPRVVDLDVEGPLSALVVRRAIERALPAVHRCGRGAARVAFTIDEMQRASAIHVEGDRTACVMAALGQVRTDAAPDVGDARVAMKISL